MNGFERRTMEKKNTIVQVARVLFSKRGITDVGISEIAKKANVSQVSIYNYFGDKNTLAKEALYSYVDKIISEYEVILENKIPFDEKIQIIMDKKQNAVMELSRFQFSSQAWEDRTLQQIIKEAVISKTLAFYTRFIELGKKEGAIDESISNDAILTFLHSSLSIMQQPGYLDTSLTYKMSILRLFLYGILGKE